MRHKSVLLLTGLGVSLLTVALVVVFSPREPSYAGKPIARWIDQLPARLVMTNGYSESYPTAYATIAEAKADEARLLRASEEARKARIQGEVALAIVVDVDGRPKNIKVVRSVGHGLDEESMRAIKHWRFSPGTKDGVPVPVQVDVTMNFRLGFF